MRSQRDEDEFQRAKAMVEALILQDDNNELDLYYFDESGFSLTPCVPYAWQEIGKTIEIPSSRSKQFNVLGFVNRKCQFESIVVEGSVNTDVVIACIDGFANRLKSPATLIIDNAPTHTSKAFLAQIDKWKKQGLTIQPISPYSPELNIIEIVWRKIKYEWLPFSAYESIDTLRDNLFEVLANIGIKYQVNFN